MTVAVTDSPGTAEPPARKQPRSAASTSVHIPGPRNRTNPARDSASSCRTRNPGGPLATALKKPCHQPTSRAFERAVSAPSVTSGRDLRVHRQHRDERAEVRGVRGVDVLVQVVLDVRAHQRLQRVQRAGAHAVQRTVERGEVDAVHAGRAPPRRAAPPSPGSPSPRPRTGGEGVGVRRTRSGWPCSSSWYQPQAISLAISGHTSARRSTSPRATSGSTACRAEEPGQLRAAAAQRVLGLRVVERAPRRPDVQHRLPAGGHVAQLARPGPARSARRGPRTAAPRGRRTPARCPARSPARRARCPTGRCRWSAPAAGSAGPPRRPGRRGRARRRSGWRRGARRRARRRPRAASRRRRGGRAGPPPSSVRPTARHSWTCTRTPAGRSAMTWRSTQPR